MKKRAKEPILYVVFGVLTTLVNLLVYHLALGLGLSYAIGNTVAFVVSILFAYVTNKIVVFESKHSGFTALVSEFAKFIAARLSTFVMEMVGLWVFIDWLGFDEWLPKYIMTVLVIVLNYFLSKWVVFKKVTTSEQK
jgi:putative flippase GtrA